MILESNLQENVHFLGSPKLSEKKIIYQESL